MLLMIKSEHLTTSGFNKQGLCFFKKKSHSKIRDLYFTWNLVFFNLVIQLCKKHCLGLQKHLLAMYKLGMAQTTLSAIVPSRWPGGVMSWQFWGGIKVFTPLLFQGPLLPPHSLGLLSSMMLFPMPEQMPILPTSVGFLWWLNTEAMIMITFVD